MRLLTVESRANSHDFGNGFDHLVALALSCTIEDDVVCGRSIEVYALDHLMKWCMMMNGVA